MRNIRPTRRRSRLFPPIRVFHGNPPCYVNLRLNRNVDPEGNRLHHHEIHALGCLRMPRWNVLIGPKSFGEEILRGNAKDILDKFCRSGCGDHDLDQDISLCRHWSDPI